MDYEVLYDSENEAWMVIERNVNRGSDYWTVKVRINEERLAREICAGMRALDLANRS